MPKQLKQGLPLELADEKAQRVNRNHRERIDELQELPFAGANTILSIELADGVPRPIPHKLGRIPNLVLVSVTRGAVSAGYVNELRDGSYDRQKYVTLRADGFGATIIVDMAVL